MHLAEAMLQNDCDEFINAMHKEIKDHTDCNHWTIYSCEEMKRTGYKGRVIMAVWSFKRKRKPFSEITKYKARLCAHGGQMQKGVHYEDSYSPVVSWTTVRLLLTLALVHSWQTRQINFVLAYPQAETRTTLFMELPKQYEVQQGSLKRNINTVKPTLQPHVLKLEKNLYGFRDGGLTWFKHLTKGL